jgi:hypothetical protein
MSLWLESCYGYGGGRVDANASLEVQEDQARRILAHLAMRVPRAWWEKALQKGGDPDPSYARLVRDLHQQLHKLPELAARASCPVLVALAFVDGEGPEPKFGTVSSSSCSIEEYLAAAERVLAERPELNQLGQAIDHGAS